MDGRTDRLAGGYINEQTDNDWMDGWMDGWMVGWLVGLLGG